MLLQGGVFLCLYYFEVGFGLVLRGNSAGDEDASSGLHHFDNATADGELLTFPLTGSKCNFPFTGDDCNYLYAEALSPAYEILQGTLLTVFAILALFIVWVRGPKLIRGNKLVKGKIYNCFTVQVHAMCLIVCVVQLVANVDVLGFGNKLSILLVTLLNELTTILILLLGVLMVDSWVKMASGLSKHPGVGVGKKRVIFGLIVANFVLEAVAIFLRPQHYLRYRGIRLIMGACILGFLIISCWTVLHKLNKRFNDSSILIAPETLTRFNGFKRRIQVTLCVYLIGSVMLVTLGIQCFYSRSNGDFQWIIRPSFHTLATVGLVHTSYALAVVVMLAVFPVKQLRRPSSSLSMLKNDIKRQLNPAVTFASTSSQSSGGGEEDEECFGEEFQRNNHQVDHSVQTSGLETSGVAPTTFMDPKKSDAALIRILTNEEKRVAFFKYSTQVLGVDHCMCYDAVETFQLRYASKHFRAARHTAEYVFETFLGEGRERLMLSKGCFQRLRATKLDKIRVKMFDEAKREIFTLMSKFLFPRFEAENKVSCTEAMRKEVHLQIKAFFEAIEDMSTSERDDIWLTPPKPLARKFKGKGKAEAAFKILR